MLKYVNTAVVLREIPNEITLCINISNCPCHCKGCHSSYLAEDIGEELTLSELLTLISKNEGITCVAFMGGDGDAMKVGYLADHVKRLTGLRTAWYSGRETLSPLVKLEYFNYIKLGPYIEEYGPLDNPNTNQRFYEVQMSREIDENEEPVYGLMDITEIFWK